MMLPNYWRFNRADIWGVVIVAVVVGVFIILNAALMLQFCRMRRDWFSVAIINAVAHESLNAPALLASALITAARAAFVAG